MIDEKILALARFGLVRLLKIRNLFQGIIMFELVHAVIHSFSKEPQTNVVTKEVKKQELLDSQMDSVISLVETLNGLLSA